MVGFAFTPGLPAISCTAISEASLRLRCSISCSARTWRSTLDPPAMRNPSFKLDGTSQAGGVAEGSPPLTRRRGLGGAGGRTALARPERHDEQDGDLPGLQEEDRVEVADASVRLRAIMIRLLDGRVRRMHGGDNATTTSPRPGAGETPDCQRSGPPTTDWTASIENCPRPETSAEPESSHFPAHRHPSPRSGVSTAARGRSRWPSARWAQPAGAEADPGRTQPDVPGADRRRLTSDRPLGADSREATQAGASNT